MQNRIGGLVERCRQAKQDDFQVYYNAPTRLVRTSPTSPATAPNSITGQFWRLLSKRPTGAAPNAVVTVNLNLDFNT